MSLFSVKRVLVLVSRPQPVLSHWRSWEPLEAKPRKIIKMTPWLSAKMICKESRMPQTLKPKTKSFKRKPSKKNKRKPLLPRPRQEKRKCKHWIRLELWKWSQMNGNKQRRIRPIHFYLKLKRRWTKRWMMLNTWTKWSYIPKL